MRRAIGVLLGIVLAASLAPAVSANLAAVDSCVSNYEDALTHGDVITVCSTSPTLIRIPDLSKRSDGLHNGCNDALPPAGPSWGDCISSGAATINAANYSIHWYADANYGHQIWCYDMGPGGHVPDFELGGFSNDTISSFRVLAGGC